MPLPASVSSLNVEEPLDAPCWPVILMERTDYVMTQRQLPASEWMPRYSEGFFFAALERNYRQRRGRVSKRAMGKCHCKEEQRANSIIAGAVWDVLCRKPFTDVACQPLWIKMYSQILPPSPFRMIPQIHIRSPVLNPEHGWSLKEP